MANPLLSFPEKYACTSLIAAIIVLVHGRVEISLLAVEVERLSALFFRPVCVSSGNGKHSLAQRMGMSSYLLTSNWFFEKKNLKAFDNLFILL